MKPTHVLKGIYALWYREFKVFLNEQSRILSAVFLPMFWYFIFGSGVGSITTTGINYQHFIFPGFLAMTIIFSSLFNGAYIVWDKKIDFLKEVLIAPLSRTTIFVGKVVGGMTDALIQAFILIIIGTVIGIPFTIVNTLYTVFILFIFTIGLVSLGLIIGSFLESPESFGLVSSFVVYPLFLLSGALYPLDTLPAWMKVLTRLDPATFAVDGLRNVILGISSMSLIHDLSVLIAFDISLILIGTWAFNRMKL
ncbi:MAG: ABC transporter permease [Bacteroidetes bacterium]|nr:ABC transporter permease [Bacteroidota bacterium]